MIFGVVEVLGSRYGFKEMVFVEVICIVNDEHELWEVTLVTQCFFLLIQGIRRRIDEDVLVWVRRSAWVRKW